MTDERKIGFYKVEEFQEAVETLSKAILEDNPGYSYIYGVPKSGVILAVALSIATGIPLTDEFDPEINILVVDDICNTGATWEKYRPCDFVCLHANSITKANPTYVAHFGIRDRIVYWWNVK